MKASKPDPGSPQSLSESGTDEVEGRDSYDKGKGGAVEWGRSAGGGGFRCSSRTRKRTARAAEILLSQILRSHTLGKNETETAHFHLQRNNDSKASREVPLAPAPKHLGVTELNIEKLNLNTFCEPG